MNGINKISPSIGIEIPSEHGREAQVRALACFAFTVPCPWSLSHTCIFSSSFFDPKPFRSSRVPPLAESLKFVPLRPPSSNPSRPQHLYRPHSNLDQFPSSSSRGAGWGFQISRAAMTASPSTANSQHCQTAGGRKSERRKPPLTLRLALADQFARS